MATLSEEVTVRKILRRGPSKFKGAASPAPAPESEFPEDESEFPEEPKIVAMPSVALISKEDALTAPQYAKSLTVTDQPTLDKANGFLKDVKAIGAKIAETFDPQIKKAHELHGSLLAEKKKFTAPLDDAEKIVKKTIAGYLAEEDRKRREAEAERARIEAEARAEADKKLRAVEKAEAKGDFAKAESIAQDALNVMEAKIEAAPVIPEAPMAAGLSLTKNWKFRIIDKKLIPLEYLAPDEVKIGRVVRALKNEANIPGVSVYSEDSVSSRTY
jgi:ribosomal protein S17E